MEASEQLADEILELRTGGPCVQVAAQSRTVVRVVTPTLTFTWTTCARGRTWVSAPRCAHPPPPPRTASPLASKGPADLHYRLGAQRLIGTAVRHGQFRACYVAAHVRL